MSFPYFLNPARVDPNFMGASFIYVRDGGTTLAWTPQWTAARYATTLPSTTLDPLRWYLFACPTEDAVRVFLETYSTVSDNLNLFSPMSSDAWNWPEDVRREGRLAMGPGSFSIERSWVSGDWLMPSYFYVGGYGIEPRQFFAHALDLSDLYLKETRDLLLEQVRSTLVNMAKVASQEPMWVPPTHTRYQMLLGDL